MTELLKKSLFKIIFWCGVIWIWHWATIAGAFTGGFRFYRSGMRYLVSENALIKLSEKMLILMANGHTDQVVAIFKGRNGNYDNGGLCDDLKNVCEGCGLGDCRFKYNTPMEQPKSLPTGEEIDGK